MDSNDIRTVIRISIISKKTNDVVENRRFSFVGVPSVQSIYEAFSGKGVLCYKDNTGELITLRTQADLDEMWRICARESDGSIRLLSFGHTASAASAAAADAKRAVGAAVDAAQPVLQRVATGAKKAAEEAIVLGVRAYSSLSDKPGAPTTAAPALEKSGSNGNVNSNNSKVDVLASSPSLSSAPSASTTATADQSIGSRIIGATKQAAEELLVLGVRGASYVENQLSSSGDSNSNAPKPEEQPAAAEPAPVPAAAPVVVPAPAPDVPAVPAAAPAEQSSIGAIGSRIFGVTRQAAEELLVLGVRGASYVENRLSHSNEDLSSSPPAVAGVIPPPVATAAPVVVDNAPLSSSWVNVAPASAAPAPPAVPSVASSASSVVPDFELERKLQDLSAMGFKDEALNRATLIKFNLDLEKTVEDLLKW